MLKYFKFNFLILLPDEMANEDRLRPKCIGIRLGWTDALLEIWKKLIF